MISEKEVEVMMNAYRLMYRIENTLRCYIVSNMREFYGINWYSDAPRQEKLRCYNRPFRRLYFHELIPFLVVYPCLSRNISSEIINSLQSLIPIRNKIAHHEYLVENEMNKLNNYYNIIMERIIL